MHSSAKKKPDTPDRTPKTVATTSGPEKTKKKRKGKKKKESTTKKRRRENGLVEDVGMTGAEKERHVGVEDGGRMGDLGRTKRVKIPAVGSGSTGTRAKRSASHAIAGPECYRQESDRGDKRLVKEKDCGTKATNELEDGPTKVQEASAANVFRLKNEKKKDKGPPQRFDKKNIPRDDAHAHMPTERWDAKLRGKKKKKKKEGISARRVQE